MRDTTDITDTSDLLQELATAGAVEAKGGFSIDPEKAREKLRQYQLADPQRYVLLLVEAAVACGATKLEFEIDSDDVHLRFDGANFRYAQLENIYGSLFASVEGSEQDRARLRGLQQLAFAVNSAMALNPRYVRVVSVGPDDGSRLELRPDVADLLEPLAARSDDRPAADAWFCNWIHVKDRLRPGLVLEFFRSIRGNLVETNLIREHCRWSRTPITVNGELVTGPMEFAGDPWTTVDVFEPVDSGVRIGAAALGLKGERGQFVDPTAKLLSSGVFIEEIAVPGGVWGFTAIVDSPGFGKDVSQTKLLRDPSFDAVVRAIIRAQGRAVARLAERAIAGTAPGWTADLLLAWLQIGEWDRLRDALRNDEVFALVADVPLWPTIGAAEVTTRALIESGVVRFATVDFEFAPVDVPFVLALAVDDGHARRRTLDKLFGSQMNDYTAALEREYQRQRKRLEFMSRLQLPELGDGHYALRESFATTRTTQTTRGIAGPPQKIRGEVGIRVIGARDSWVRLVHEGCLLQEVAVDHPVAGLRAVVETELTPNGDYDRAEPDEHLAAALIAVLAGLLRALTSLAASGAVTRHTTELRELVRGFVAELVQPDYAVEFLLQFGFTRSRARQELDRLGPSELRRIIPDWFLRDGSDRAHPLTGVPLFTLTNGRSVSLAELAVSRARGERIRWLEAGQGPIPVLDVDVLLLDRLDREVLRAMFDKDALEPFAEQLARLRRREAFLERPRQPLRLPTVTVVQTSFQTGSIRGELGLSKFGFSHAGDGDSRIRVYYQERELCELSLELPLPGLVAWVESDSFEITPNFDGLADPTELRATLLEPLVELIRVEIKRARAKPSELRRYEWWALAMVPNIILGVGALATALVELRAAQGQARALADLDGLLALLERFSERDLDRAIGRIRSQQRAPTAELVEAELGRPSRRPTRADGEALSLRRRLLAVMHALLELPMWRRFTGPAVDGTSARELTLASLYDCVGAGEPISWVGEDFQLAKLPRIEFEVVGLDPIEQRLLQDQFGAPGLELIGEWLTGRAQFERRRTISEVRVPRGSALLVIEVSGEGWRGELGLVRDAPRDVLRSKIRVFTDDREAAVIDLPAKPIPVIGALRFDALELNDRFDDVTAGERERIRGLVQARSDELIVELAARFSKFDSNDRPRAAMLVRYLLATWPPGTGGYAARAHKRAKLFRALAELPVFAGARKRWSAAELAEARDRGPIWTIGYRGEVALPDTPVVLLDADDVEPTLVALFGPTRDRHAQVALERALAARKASAPVLASRPPASALASTKLNQERLEGHLWICAGREQVSFGAEGRVVEQREVAPYCWCGGAVAGSGLNIAEDWSRVVLSRSQDRMLERSAVELWSQLVDDFVRLGHAKAPRSTAERQRYVSIRDALSAVFLDLHAAFGRDSDSKNRKKNKSNKNKRKHGNKFEQLYEKVREAPLLELRNGRWISADVAARERPIELASMHLWTGPSAEELAHERAVERREAERARRAKLDEQNRAEAARRREAAAARQREDARRREAQRNAQRNAEQAEREREREQANNRERDSKRERERSEQQARGRRASVQATPAAPAEAPTPNTLLLEAVREELRLVRANKHGLLSNRLLDSLVLGPELRRKPLLRHVDASTQFNPSHPLFEAVVRGYLDDPTLVTLLASAAYTFLNIIHTEIADSDEAEFLRLHAAHAVTGSSFALG